METHILPGLKYTHDIETQKIHIPQTFLKFPEDLIHSKRRLSIRHKKLIYKIYYIATHQ